MAWLIKNNEWGFTLVEAVISVAVLMVIAVGGVAANRLATSSVTINQLRSKANSLAVQDMEVLMSLRGDNFLGLTVGVFHPVFDGVKWSLSPGSEMVDGFTRSITLSPVQRSLVCFTAVCEITTQGGINDPGSLYAEVKTGWVQAGQNKEIIINSIITYWR
jgi:hypothetical protein